jgi:hypothetical protein
MREGYGARVLASEIRTSASLAESARGGETVFDRDITSRGARDYANAADEMNGYLFPEAAETTPDDHAAGPLPNDQWVALNRF